MCSFSHPNSSWKIQAKRPPAILQQSKGNKSLKLSSSPFGYNHSLILSLLILFFHLLQETKLLSIFISICSLFHIQLSFTFLSFEILSNLWFLLFLLLLVLLVLVKGRDGMVELHSSNSALIKPLKPIEVPSYCVGLFPSKTSDFQPKNTHAISIQPLLDLNLLNIKTHDRYTLLTLMNSTTYTNSPQNITHSHSLKSSTSLNFPPKSAYSFHDESPPYLAVARRCTKFREKPMNLPLKPMKFRPKATKLSPITSQILARIYKHSPSPNIVTYTSFIKFLGDSGHANEAAELFGIMKESHPPDVISFTVLIQILCESNQLDQALGLIQEMPKYNCKPDIFCYNILIDKLGEAGCGELVSKFWSEMRSNGVRPDVVTYSSLVKSLCITEKFDEALYMLEYMEMNTAIKLNTYVYNTIIKSFLDCGRTDEALGLLGRMQIRGCGPDLCSFNLFIKYYSDLGEGLEAYVILKEMLRRGIEASEGSYRMCVLGLVREGKLREVLELVEKIRNSSISLGVSTWNKLIMWLGERGRIDEAYMVFMGVRDPDEITMNIVIHMLFNHGRFDKAWEVFNLMKDMKIEPSTVTYNILIHGLGKEGRVREASKLVNQMEDDEHLSPDVITYNCLLDALCKAGEVDNACKLLLDMERRGCTSDLISYNTLINGLIGVGRVDDASRLFEHMRGTLAAHTIPLERLLMEIVERKNAALVNINCN